MHSKYPRTRRTQKERLKIAVGAKADETPLQKQLNTRSEGSTLQKKETKWKSLEKRKRQGIFSPWLKTPLKKSLLIYSCIIPVLKQTIPQNSSQ